jgi:hypothetical protein
MVAKRTDMKVANAVAAPTLESEEKVLGSEHSHEMAATIPEKPTVHKEWFVIVLRYLAPTRQ